MDERTALDIQAIERATAAAVAPAEVEEFRGWLVAYDTVTVIRARSAVPLRHDSPDCSAVTPVCERYLARGIAPAFRVPQLASMREVERELARANLAARQPTRVMVARARDVAGVAHGGVQVAAEPDDAWAAVFQGEGFDPADGASRVATLTRAKGSLFAGIREGDDVVAGGVLAMGHGWASIHGMRTALSHRGRGLASRVLGALAREAIVRGHDRIFLQVEVANDTATRVYSRCGFELAWTYAHWC